MADDPLKKHHDDVVTKTWNFADRIEDEKDDVLNAVLGLGGEAGEIVDFHKKLFYHRKPKDESAAREELKLELGDLCYYLARILWEYNFTLEEVLEANKVKLFERHGVRD